MNDENADNKELLKGLRSDVEEVEKDLRLKRKEKIPVVLKRVFICAFVVVLIVFVATGTFSFIINKYAEGFKNPIVKELSEGMRSDLNVVLSHSFSLFFTGWYSLFRLRYLLSILELFSLATLIFTIFVYRESSIYSL